MPATVTDRLRGLTTSVAIKPPCKAVSTASITLSGEQTVGGVACIAGDRVLMAITGGSVSNGIWVVDTGAWSRAADFDGARDVVFGTTILVLDSAANIGFWVVTTDADIVPGATVIELKPAGGDPTTLLLDLASPLATKGPDLVGYDGSEAYGAGTVGSALNALFDADAALDDQIAVIDDGILQLEASRSASFARRRVPSAFVRGDGNTRTDIFPLSVNYPGPGGVVLSKSPLDIARSLGNVAARTGDDDVWVAPVAVGTGAGTSRANAMGWSAAFKTLTSGRKLLMIDDDGPYPPLSLVSGVDAGAGTPKWLYAVDGRVRIAAATSLGQPVSQTWTLHSGSVYKTVLTAVTYDQPQAVLAELVPDVRDGQPSSILKHSSVAGLTGLGSSGEGWYFDQATDTLYMTYYGSDLTVSGNRNFHIVYSSQTLDSLGGFSAEWALGGCTVILEGNFELDGVWINSYEANSSLPILLAEGRLQQLCSTYYGIRCEGLTYTKGHRCYRPKHDGVNGYKSTMTGATGFTIAADIVVTGAGDIGTHGTGGASNNQGFSVHGKHNAMIFGGLFEGNFGQGWADICDSTHNSASWGVGVIVRDNAIVTGVSNGIYMDGSSGGGTGGRSAWLDTCASENDTRSLVALTSAVKIYNCQLPEQLAASGGAITDYAPGAP